MGSKPNEAENVLNRARVTLALKEDVFQQLGPAQIDPHGGHLVRHESIPKSPTKRTSYFN